MVIYTAMNPFVELVFTSCVSSNNPERRQIADFCSSNRLDSDVTCRNTTDS